MVVGYTTTYAISASVRAGCKCSIMYLGGGSRHFHKGDPFYFRNHFFYRNIKRYRDVIQRENYTRHGKKKTDKDETGNILLKYVFTSL